MKTGMMLSLAAGALALALLLPGGQASAAPLAGASGLPAAAQGMNNVEQARTVCRRWWNGHRWRQRCRWVPNHGYYGPGPYYRHHRYRHYRW